MESALTYAITNETPPNHQESCLSPAKYLSSDFMRREKTRPTTTIVTKEATRTAVSAARMKLSKFLRHRSDDFHSAGLERMVDGFERRGNLTTIDCGYVRLRSITDGEEEVFQTGGKRAAQTTEDFSGQESFGIGEFFSRADFDGFTLPVHMQVASGADHFHKGIHN